MCLNWSRDLLFINTTKDVQYYDIAERTPGRRHIDEIGCAPGCATTTDQGELVIAVGDGLKYYNVACKQQQTTKPIESYVVAGQKFQIISNGKYICVLIKDHNIGLVNWVYY